MKMNTTPPPHLPQSALATARGPHDDDTDALLTGTMQLQDLIDLWRNVSVKQFIKQFIKQFNKQLQDLIDLWSNAYVKQFTHR